MVQRYSNNGFCVADADGGYVKYEDYVKLEAELQKYKDQFPDYVECANCGSVTHVEGVEHEACEHEWVEFHGLVIAPEDPRNEPGYLFCRKCGLKEYSRKCKHEWSYIMGDGPGIYECDVCGAQSKTLPYDLRWLS